MSRYCAEKMPIDTCLKAVWLALILLEPADVFAGDAKAPQTRVQEVSTLRSDGAIFPQVRQFTRQQKLRQVKVSGSIQALPGYRAWSRTTEPPSGGTFVAPAGDAHRDVAHTLPVIIVPIVPTNNKRRQ